MKRQLLLTVLFLAVGAITTQAQTLVVKKQIVDKLIAMERLTQAEVEECGGVNKILHKRLAQPSFNVLECRDR